MARNVELKALDPDPEATLRAALAAGASDEGVIWQRDTYFHVAGGRLKLREQDRGDAELIAYERPDDPAVRVSNYHRTPIEDPDTLRTGLAATCGIRVVVEKHRHLLIWQDVRIHLDAVVGLDPHVELEAVVADGATLDAGEQRVAELRGLLGIEDANLRSGSYADALLAGPDPELVRLARAAAANAYAPYSGLQVGAAIRTHDGSRFAGANVENAAYPQGQCAEASAIAAMVAAGANGIDEVVVTSQDGVAPCGGCRQRLAEFAAPATPVHMVAAGGAARRTTLGELLPLAFGAQDLA